MGCHFLLQCVKAKSESEVAQSCLTLSDPMDCILPGSSVHGIFQARVLEWVAIKAKLSQVLELLISFWIYGPRKISKQYAFSRTLWLQGFNLARLKFRREKLSHNFFFCYNYIFQLNHSFNGQVQLAFGVTQRGKYSPACIIWVWCFFITLLCVCMPITTAPHKPEISICQGSFVAAAFRLVTFGFHPFCMWF